MNILHINAKQQRLDADKQNRSDAINRTLTDNEQAIEQLKAELFATRVTAVFALVGMGYALFHALAGGVA